MDIDATSAAVGAAIVLSAGVLAVVANDALRRRARIGRRLESVAELLDVRELPAAVPVRQDAAEVAPLVAALNRRYPLAGGTRAAVVAGATGVVAALGLAAGLVFVGVPDLLATVLGAALGFGLAWQVGAVLEQRQRLLFQDRLLVPLDDFQRMVRFGIPTPQAFGSIAESADEPVGSCLRRVVLDADIGVPLSDALGREARRVRIAEMAMLAAIMTTQSRAGGGLGEAVGNLADMLRERIGNRSKLKSTTAESKISLIILTCVPFAAIGIQSVMQPELVDALLNDARHLLGIGVGLIATGVAVAWFLVRSVEK